jgi:hypothetical protein
MGLTVLADHETKVHAKLNEYLLPGGVLDATKMQNDWFPQLDADVFISHSHNDKHLAITFSGWLKNRFSINAFVDSVAWDYAGRLLRKIDEKHSRSDDDPSLFSYEKRNGSTSHVHMMLATALVKMIDRSECLFFLNTPASVTSGRAIRDSVVNTGSPWIYAEIAMSRMIRITHPARERVAKSMVKAAAVQELNERLRMLHGLELDHLTDLSDDDLIAWDKGFGASPFFFSLDYLYDFKDET